MPRRRKSNETVGWVNFPVNTIESSGEGGMVVRLVVVDKAVRDTATNKKSRDLRWVPCCGGYQYFHYEDVFLGDDLVDQEFPYPDDLEDGSTKEEFMAWLAAEGQAREGKDHKYFPNLDGPKPEYESIPVLMAMTIGATGWSNQWVCTFDDLTQEGKELVEMAKRLYPNGDVRLLTFLDT